MNPKRKYNVGRSDVKKGSGIISLPQVTSLLHAQKLQAQASQTKLSCPETPRRSVLIKHNASVYVYEHFWLVEIKSYTHHHHLAIPCVAVKIDNNSKYKRT
jgi:hypothetical protein